MWVETNFNKIIEFSMAGDSGSILICLSIAVGVYTGSRLSLIYIVAREGLA
jgi:hypothetical protein